MVILLCYETNLYEKAARVTSSRFSAASQYIQEKGVRSNHPFWKSVTRKWRTLRFWSFRWIKEYGFKNYLHPSQNKILILQSCFRITNMYFYLTNRHFKTNRINIWWQKINKLITDFNDATVSLTLLSILIVITNKIATNYPYNKRNYWTSCFEPFWSFLVKTKHKKFNIKQVSYQ